MLKQCYTKHDSSHATVCSSVRFLVGHDGIHVDLELGDIRQVPGDGILRFPHARRRIAEDYHDPLRLAQQIDGDAGERLIAAVRHEDPESEIAEPVFLKWTLIG